MSRSTEERTAGAAEDSGPSGPLLRLAAMLYVVCTPLDIIPIPAVGSPVAIVGFLFLCAWGVALLRGEVRMPKAGGLLLVLVALVTWSFATVSWSYAPSLTMTKSISTLLVVLSAIAISGVFPGRVERPASALALGAGIVGLAAIVSGPETESGSEQASFLGIDQNVIAFHVSLGLASALFVLLRTSGSWRRAGMSLVIVVQAAALIVVGSRTGIGSGFALVLVFVVISMGSMRRAFRALGLLTGLVLISGWISARGLVPSRVLDWLEDPTVTDSRAGIISAYRMTQDEWMVRGIGAGADADYLFAVTSWYKNAHSALWKVWIELGMVGLALWGLLLAGLSYRAWRSADRSFFVLSGIPILLFFYTLGPLNSNALWVVFGLALGSEIPRVSVARVPTTTLPLARSKPRRATP